MKFKLIDNWKEAWKWSSTRLMAITGALTTAWLAIPEDLRSAVPPRLMASAVLVLVLAGAIARVTVFEKAPKKRKKR